MRKYIICLFLLVGSASVYAQSKPLLAVTAITANGVSEADATACRSIVETALFKTDLYTVLSYNDMQEILEAQAFSLSGCTDDSCAIEVGKLLAAEIIVLGELSAVGSTYNLAVRMIDVGTSRTVGAEVVTFSSLDEMQEQVFSASYKLAGLDYNPETGVSFEVVGEIYVTAPDDLELEVFLDGESVGITPLLIENVVFGSHLVEVKSEDNVFTKEITILSKDIVEIEADIKLLTGNVILTVIPKEAAGYEITIGDFSAKKGLNKAVPAGTKQIHVEGDGWFYIDDVEIESGVTTRLTIELIPGGYLEILGTEGAAAKAVNKDGELIQLKANSTNTLAAGSYKVTVSHPDYKDTVIDVEIVRDETLRIEQELEYTEEYLIREEIAELSLKLEGAKKSTAFWKGCSWIFGSITAVSASVAAAGEYMIWSATDELTELAPLYDAATTQAEVDRLGAAITAEEDNIFIWREFRDTSLYIGAPAAGFTLISVLLAGREASIERKIEKLQGALNEE